MAYEKQTFTDFDQSNPLCAAQLNHIENGIVQLETDLENSQQELQSYIDQQLGVIENGSY